MWFEKSVVYHIYPFGFVNCLYKNDGVLKHNLKLIEDRIGHIKELGCDTIYFSPVFSSDYHGYDTKDYKLIDNRLGTNQDFKQLSKTIHDNNMKIVFDGVFNHVGRGFWAFIDVLENRENSRYVNWFNIDFTNRNHRDGFYYEGWEGHDELVKLNLKNPEVVNHLLECVKFWIDEFGIDGIRLDVAYMVDEDFMRKLNSFTKSYKEEFFLVGEMLHGDYKRIMNPLMLDSVTNYTMYKSTWSAINDLNLFEAWFNLEEMFTRKYVGSHTWNFLDNHDVNRIASVIKNEKHLSLAYGMLFSIPGIPCIYYGSEWGVKGERSKYEDTQLRPYFDTFIQNDLFNYIKKLIEIHKSEDALIYGSIKKLHLNNRQLIFERAFNNERILVAINLDDEPVTVHFNADAGRAKDLISDKVHDFGGGSVLEANSISYWKVF